MRELVAYAIILLMLLTAIGLYVGRRIGQKRERKRRGRYFGYVPPGSHPVASDPSED